MYQVETQQFNGPYDLLLQLIEKRDLDITDIALAEVTEQFLAHLDQIAENEIDSDELVSFLVVASKLLYLKSKALLPAVEDDEDPQELEKHLKLYKSFVEATQGIQELLADGRYSYPKQKQVVVIKTEFREPVGVTQDIMEQLFVNVINRLRPIVRLPKALLERTVSLNERISQMRNILLSQKKLHFNHIVNSSENKLDVIVSFLALLELANQKKVTFHQEKHFEDIVIKHL